MSNAKAYYNEHDPKAAAWLHELIKANLIAPGEVDERSIEDVLPSELAGYTQCHFFAGIGVWSYALRCAGWPDDRPVWTGSCPCQPFSKAGEGKGFADERYLWPAFHWLISQRRPDVVFGEQVESKDGRAWLDTVQADMEASSYAFGAVGLCAAGVGAPHIRPRLFFVADTTSRGSAALRAASHKRGADSSLGSSRKFGRLANAHGNGAERNFGSEDCQGSTRGAKSLSGREVGVLGDANLAGSQGRGLLAAGSEWFSANQCIAGAASLTSGMDDAPIVGHERNPRAGRQAEHWTKQRGPTNGFWANAEWLYCRDEKYRAVESGTFPLAARSAARVGRLRGYGNAICAPLAEEFIRAYMEAAA